MSSDARSWLGLLIVVLIAMALVSLMVSIRARERGRSRVRRALALIWAAVLASVAAGWVLDRLVGGPVFEVNLFGAPELLTRSLTGPQLALLIVGLAAIAGLYVTAILSLRGLMAGLPPVAPPEEHADGEEEAQ